MEDDLDYKSIYSRINKGLDTAMNYNDVEMNVPSMSNDYGTPFSRNDIYEIPADRKRGADGKYPARKKSNISWKGLDPQTLSRKKGQMASIRFNKLQPWKTYGAARLQRGTPWNLQQFGKNWKEADNVQKNNRLQSGYTGDGAYKWNDFKRNVRDVGKMVGRPILNALQNKAVQMIGAGLLGAGSYGEPNIMSSTTSGNFGQYSGDNIVSNSLINNDSPTRMLQQSSDETNSITITNSEYIGDIIPSGSGFLTSYFLSLNPGLSDSFPWLSNIAQFYEEYEFQQLVFTFKSMVTEGNSTASGTVLMCTQYNPSNAAFTSKQVMENYDYANSAKVTSDISHGIECDISKRAGGQFEYIRTGPVPSNQDLKTYDLATFQLATTGATANLTLGELWVSYKVKLLKSKIPQLGNYITNGVVYESVVTAAGTASSLFGTNPVISSVVGNLTNFSFSANTITFPSNINVGTYIFTLSFVCTAQPSVDVVVSSNFGVPDFVHQSTASTSNVATSRFIIVYKLVINSSSTQATTVTFSGLTGIITTSCLVSISQISSD